MSKSNPYVIVSRDLSIRFSESIQSDGIALSTHRTRSPHRGGSIYINGIAAVRMAEQLKDVIGDIRAIEHKAATGHDIAYCLRNLDPWLLALMCLMWEGVVQGLAWDAVKESVLTAFRMLQGRGLAPSPKASRREFTFESYADLGSWFQIYCRLQWRQSQQEVFRVPSIEEPPISGEDPFLVAVDKLRKADAACEQSAQKKVAKSKIKNAVSSTSNKKKVAKSKKKVTKKSPAPKRRQQE